MTRLAAPRTQPGRAPIPASRVEVLDAGRAAAVRRRRADSEQCRQRVLNVLAAMRKSRQALSDAEITQRAAVNPQYLQRHRDLKAEAEAVRAHLAQDGPRAAAAATARKEAALEIENRMLLEQNAALQLTLRDVQNELRTLRAHELGAPPPRRPGSPPAARQGDSGTARATRRSTRGPSPSRDRPAGTPQRQPAADGREQPADHHRWFGTNAGSRRPPQTARPLRSRSSHRGDLPLVCLLIRTRP